MAPLPAGQAGFLKVRCASVVEDICYCGKKEGGAFRDDVVE